jgi:hypothetical protein
LLKIPAQRLQQYLCQAATTETACADGKSRAVRRRCDAVALGSLTLELKRNDLWPLPAAEEYRLSASKLGSIISNIKILHEKEHSSCGSKGFKITVSTVLDDIPSPVLDSHRRHMKTQAAQLKAEVDPEEIMDDISTPGVGTDYEIDPTDSGYGFDV